MNAKISLGNEANVLGCDNVSQEKLVNALRSTEICLRQNGELMVGGYHNLKFRQKFPKGIYQR